MALLLSLVANLQQRQPYRAGYFPVDWRISWTLNLLQGTLAPAAPKGVVDTSVPRPYDYATQLRTWTASYNLNLIGQDKLPAGVQRTDLPPRPYEYHVQLRTWTWNYNLNLIGKDVLPPGKPVYDLPFIGPAYPVSLRTSIALPIIPPPPQVTVVPRAPYFSPPRQPLRFDYDIYRNIALLSSVTAQLPFNQFDWPVPKAPQPLLQTWTASYNLNLIGQDKLPIGEQVTGLPPQPAQQPIPIMVASYNLNLIGKDVLPPGSKLSDLPPRDYDRAVQLRTWIQSVNVALTVQAAQVPFNQYDWPVPKGPQPLLQTWTSSFNLNLIGKDKLPNRQQDWPNPTQPYRMPQSWASSYNPNLIGKDKLPFRQMDWPVPRGPEYPINLRTSIFYPQITPPPSRLPFNQYDWPLPQVAAQPDRTYTFTSQFLTPFVPPPIPTTVGPDRPWVRDWWDRDEWGNFYPGSGIHRG